MKPDRIARLQRFLGGLVEDHLHQPDAMSPGQLARQYAHPRDRELVAFLVAMLQFGPEEERRGWIKLLLGRLGKQPARTLSRLSQQMLQELCQDMQFSFIPPEGVYLWLHALRVSLKRSNTLEELFSEGQAPGRRYLECCDRFMKQLQRSVSEEERRECRAAHLLPRPAKGSSVMRLHLFLRTVVRPDDELDLGLWQCLRPTELLLPLDGERLQLLHWLKLVTRELPDRGAVIEATRSLALLREDDPVYYSHALQRMLRLGWQAEELRNHFRRA